jgi:hypothetical protein
MYSYDVQTKDTVKLSLSVRIVAKCGTVEINLQAVLNSELVGGIWLVSKSICFNPENNPPPHLVRR